MADVNQLITLGVGTPGDIEHYILFGLSGAPEVVTPEVTPNFGTGRLIAGSRALLTRGTYRELRPRRTA